MAGSNSQAGNSNSGNGPYSGRDRRSEENAQVRSLVGAILIAYTRILERQAADTQAASESKKKSASLLGW